jgi:hypothetical protein
MLDRIERKLRNGGVLPTSTWHEHPLHGTRYKWCVEPGSRPGQFSIFVRDSYTGQNEAARDIDLGDPARASSSLQEATEPPPPREILCPACGAPGAYVGLLTAECPRQGCSLFTPKQRSIALGEEVGKVGEAKRNVGWTKLPYLEVLGRGGFVVWAVSGGGAASEAHAVMCTVLKKWLVSGSASSGAMPDWLLNQIAEVDFDPSPWGVYME